MPFLIPTVPSRAKHGMQVPIHLCIVTRQWQFVRRELPALSSSTSNFKSVESMALTTTTINSSLPAPAQAQDWTDLIGVLSTAIAPLIILFGEQATKQFLIMSMGWTDHILLATGPIGIITIVVSAIRIGGSRSLKALIGR